MSKLARALYGFPPGSVVTKQMLADRKAALDADPLYSDAAIRSLRRIVGMKLNFHSDPGHGWLAVPTAEVERVGLAGKISGYSYRSESGTTLYLEEDCDAPAYLDALRALGEPEPQINRLKQANGNSFIRRLARVQAKEQQ